MNDFDLISPVILELLNRSSLTLPELVRATRACGFSETQTRAAAQKLIQHGAVKLNSDMRLFLEEDSWPMTPQEQRSALTVWQQAMTAKMERGIQLGRTGWRDDDVTLLIARFHEEIAELFRDPTMEEAADVANFAFMIVEAIQKQRDFQP